MRIAKNNFIHFNSIKVNVEPLKIIVAVITVLFAACFFMHKPSAVNQTARNYFSFQDTSGAQLKKLAKFPIGASVDPKRLYNSAQYANIVTSQFNSITTENALKWTTVEPREGYFNFNKGDSIVAFAEKYGLRVHGHVLVTVSASSLPDWVNNFRGNKEAWENLFKNHIEGVVKHYKGKIISWDVVNETFDDNGNVRATAQSGKDVNVWALHLGNDYTARAFQYAHEAGPNALLFYNDNKQETSEKKLNAIINMAADFKKRKIPIDGLGIQMHININTSDNDITNALKKLAATGLKIHISELDIRINPNDKVIIDTASCLQAQARKFYFIAHAYKTLIPEAQQYGITFWNVADKDSWIIAYKKSKDSPLLFDKNYRKKTAYKSFSDGLAQ